MIMNMSTLDMDSSKNLADEYAANGLVVLRRLELPEQFAPSETDIVFLRIDGTCEIHMGANAVYQGGLPAWREISMRPVGPGQTRFVTSVHGDFYSGLREWLKLIRAAQAEGSHTKAQDLPGGPPNGAGEKPSAQSPSAAQLTDLDAVHLAVKEIHRPLYLDEEVLFNRLRTQVLGQDGALRALAGLMVRHCARRKPARPAVAFAVGPSGVGKTRTAEALSKVLRELDSENSGYQFLRLDMTEYQESHRVSQLIGAPQGYLGHGEGSQLADSLRANPRTIVLFDEIEKAHPAILRVLMNTMDAGRLSTADRSANGREIDCRQAAFVFTSNLDSKDILDELESRSAFGNRAVEDEVCRRRLHAAGIAPEIVGRIGRFLVFRPLTPEVRSEIVTLAIAEVAEEFGLKVGQVEPQVIVDLMEKSKSEGFGVRPERSLIDDVLGGAFTEAAKHNIPNPVSIVGPPYECTAWVLGSLSHSAQNTEEDSSPASDTIGGS
jgi:hypothetical protein